jgi:hypothetical protein
MKMKIFFKNTWIVMIAMLAFSCNESEDLVTADANEGGLLEPTAVSLNYVVGNNADYEIKVLVKQGNSVSTQQITLFKQFYSVEAAEWSNELASKVITVSETSTHFASASLNYAELIDGLSLTSGPLPTNDTDLTIGDRFSVRMESLLSDGRTVQQSFTVNLTVSTRFAGTYDVVESVYYRIGANRTDVAWPAQFSIGSVDASTYEQIEYFGAFDGNTLYFTIDNADVIDYPAEWAGEAQLGNGQPLTTCKTAPNDLSNVECVNTNMAVRDDVDGLDQLIMTYGYFTGGSGAREFYQVLTKAL